MVLGTILTQSSVMAGKIAVLADVEGDWRKIQAFVEKGDVLKINQADADGFDAELKGDAKLVFLGDSIDKGPDNLKVLKFLVDLKRKYPDRVVLLQGNRDANKLRFIWELTPDALLLNQEVEKFQVHRFRLRSWEAAFAKWSSNPAFAQVDGVATSYQHGASPVTDRILKLKWMFRDTMGAPNAFQDWKAELGGVADSQVFAQLRSLVAPEGLLTAYLRASQLAYIDDETSSLFVHGGVSQESFGIVPESRLGRGDVRKIEDLRSWVAALNAWSQERIEDALIGDVEGALPLMQYQEPEIQYDQAGHPESWAPLPNRMSIAQGRPWSEVYHLDPYHPAGFTPDLIRHFQAQGISNLIFGHSPVGQIPVLMKSKGFVFVACDTSITSPPRNAYIEVSPEAISVVATYVRPDGSAFRLLANSTDPELRRLVKSVKGGEAARSTWGLGRSVEGHDHSRWPILRAYWTQGPGPFGVPSYFEDGNARGE